MTSRLLRTQLAIDNCELHLDETNSRDGEVESYLTQHVLVILCAEIQQELISLLEARASQTSDSELKDFSVTTGKRVLRSIGKSEIAGFVGYFGVKAKKYLNDNLDDQQVTLYNNAVSNRHDVAHRSGANITFTELTDIMVAARNLLDIVERAISLNRDAAVV